MASTWTPNYLPFRKDLCKETIIRNPNEVGFVGYRYVLDTEFINRNCFELSVPRLMIPNGLKHTNSAARTPYRNNKSLTPKLSTLNPQNVFG